MLTTEEVRSRAKALMPGLTEDLKGPGEPRLMLFPGYPEEPVHECAEHRWSCSRSTEPRYVSWISVKASPPSTATCRPEGAPTVLLYAHYDVQPAPVEAGGTPTPESRAQGRAPLRTGAADDKSGVIIHAGTLGVFQGDLPVNLRILIEGEEETVSHIGPYVDAHPELFQGGHLCDRRHGQSSGRCACGDHHPSRQCGRGGQGEVPSPGALRLFGGAARCPALIRILASLHDDAGDTIVPGLAKFEWSGSEMDPDAFREAAGMVDERS